MRTLYYHSAWPAARKARIALAEKGLDADLVEVRVWEHDPDFLALNPAGDVPVLVEADGAVIAGDPAVCEYLEEAYPDHTLLGRDVLGRAEVRRLAAWFDRKFAHEVTDALVGEKLVKRLSGEGTPYAQAIRAGMANIHYHLDYIAWLAERRTWLAGSTFSLADITAAAHLSCLDYLGDVPWDDHAEACLWYARIKSRPSIRPVLADRLPGIRPPAHYEDPDF